MCSALSEKPFLMMSCILLILLDTAHWACDLRDLPGMTPRYFSWLLGGHSEFSIMKHSSDYSSPMHCLRFFYTGFHLTYEMFLCSASPPSFSALKFLQPVGNDFWPHRMASYNPQTWRFQCTPSSPGPWWKCLIKPVSVSIPQGPHCWKWNIHSVKQPKSSALCFLFFNQFAIHKRHSPNSCGDCVSLLTLSKAFRKSKYFMAPVSS